jgi:molybdopterin-guanine dinucleotide biosynthesis protein A
MSASMKMSTHKTAGVVLCGGRSSRMGVDKSRLEYRGLPLFEHMSRLLQLAGVQDVFLSGPEGIRDILPDRGPLGGMHACMNALAARFSHALFVPVDMPLLDPAQLGELVSYPSEAEALHYAEQFFPLRLALSAPARSKLMLHLTANIESQRSIRNFIRSLQTATPPGIWSDPASYLNVNTPQDWRTLGQRNP